MSEMEVSCYVCGAKWITSEPEDCPWCKLKAVAAELERVREENKAMRETTYCVYCGERFPLDGSQENAVDKHVLTCPEHPMRAAERERDEATARADRAEATVAICIHAYQTDNAIPQSVLADTPVSPVRVTVDCNPAVGLHVKVPRCTLGDEYLLVPVKGEAG